MIRDTRSKPAPTAHGTPGQSPGTLCLWLIVCTTLSLKTTKFLHVSCYFKVSIRTLTVQSRIIFKEAYDASAFSTERSNNVCSGTLIYSRPSRDGILICSQGTGWEQPNRGDSGACGHLKAFWQKQGQEQKNSLRATRDLPESRCCSARAVGGTNITTTRRAGILHQHQKESQNKARLFQETLHTWASSLPASLFYLNLLGQRPCQPHRVISISLLLPPTSFWSGCSAATPRRQLDVIINKVIDYLPRAGLEPADKLWLAPVL